MFGRLTADATVKTIKDERQVVNFSIAINDNVKAWDTGEIRKLVTYVNCSY
ncbi:single-stranded DNA-binding protein [Danxiaibacter flavus]|uniref:single-stranded DNA-binding protein n=1 Tax=Danxiaibacter flavus TaxID=3049108 RepID=UPI0034E0CCD2